MPSALRPLLLALAAVAAGPAAAQQSAPAAAAGVEVAPRAAPAPAGVEFAETTRTRAMVLTVDEETRQILMRDLDTGGVFVHRPPEAEAPLSVQPGDVVQATRTRAATARPASAADADATESEVVGAPDAAGQGFMGGRLTRTVMTLEAWNPVTGVAVVRTPEGEMRRYNASGPEARAFVDTLSPGARIEVEFSDTVRVQVER